MRRGYLSLMAHAIEIYDLINQYDRVCSTQELEARDQILKYEAVREGKSCSLEERPIVNSFTGGMIKQEEIRAIARIHAAAV